MHTTYITERHGVGKGNPGEPLTSTHFMTNMYVGIVSLAAALSWWFLVLQSAQLPSLSAAVVAQYSLSQGHQSVAPDSEQDNEKVMILMVQGGGWYWQYCMAYTWFLGWL